ncbi:MAG: PEGA domain-containing protein [Lentisphaerales bacterium]|nr:PEGA domain-containing protein [Lentisphaerales bacterium]
MKLHILGGSLEGKTLSFEGPLITIGRDESNILSLADPGVSGRHAFIEKIDNKWMIFDTGSTNGVLINGSKISEKLALENAVTLKIGVVEIHVDLEKGGTASPPPAASSSDKKKSSKEKKNTISTNSDQKIKKSASSKSGKKAPSLKTKTVHTSSFKLENSEEMDELMQENAEQRRQARKMAKLKSRTINAAVLVALIILGLFIYPEVKNLYQQAQSDKNQVATVEKTETKINYEKKALRSKTAASPANSPLYVQSYPSSATVEINGEVVGTTPLQLHEFASGSHILTIYKDGYWATEYPFSHPHNPIQIHTLRQEPNTALITSTPSGSAVTIGGQIKGHTPLLLRNLPEGYTNVTLRSQGYEPSSKEFEITPKFNRKHIHLEHSNKAGAIKIITRPPRVKIFMNGDYIDTTTSDQELALESKPLVLNGFIPGTYQMKMTSLDGSEDKIVPITLVGGEVSEVKENLWMINSVVNLKDESKVYGFLVSKKANGDVVISEEKGQTKTIPADEVDSVEAANMQDKYGFSDGIEIAADRFKPILSTIHDENDDRDFSDEMEDAKLLKASVSEVQEDIQSLDLFEMMTKYKYKNATINGKVSFIREGETKYSIVLDNRIECYLDKDDTPEQKDALVQIQGKDVTVKGFSIGLRGLDRIVLINSEFTK